MASFGVSIPDELAAEIDAKAAEWYSNRSQAITRIFLEWKQLRTRQGVLPLVVEDPTEESPTQQMKSNGASPLLAEAA